MYVYKKGVYILLQNAFGYVGLNILKDWDTYMNDTCFLKVKLENILIRLALCWRVVLYFN